MPSSGNMRSTIQTKRILQEIKEIRKAMDESPDSLPFAAEALEDDVYQWCFAIRGPADTPFSGGIYHGRILLPPEYPFKPPSFIMLSPSGRFETHTKICLSISSYHPEQWQPSWSMRTALTALIAFFPSPAKGAVGSQEATDAERAQMAIESRQKIPHVASPERMEVMRRLHAYLLRQSPSQKPGSPEILREQTEEQAKSSEISQPNATNCAESEPVEAVHHNPRQFRTNATHAPVQQQRENIQTLRVCTLFLDRLIMFCFTVLALVIAWSILYNAEGNDRII